MIDPALMQQFANAIRILSVDAVEKAKSGHPGAPMGMAEIATVLWLRHLKHSPQNPDWLNRDRFVLSNGHGSMLIYALLHLTGYKLSMEEIANFRQLKSQTPGHPEFGSTQGIETTTGPLGQGFANAVGMALGKKLLAHQFNQKDCQLIDHFVYCFVGDGCLMEGISHEAASLAGTLGLPKLITFYDANNISIDGNIEGWYNEDVKARFLSYGWSVIGPIDGHNLASIDQAIIDAKTLSKKQSRPCLIICNTTIGKGAPNKAGSSAIHGAPLGEQEIAALRQALNWQLEPFELPASLEEIKENHLERCQNDYEAWQKKWQNYQKSYPKQAFELEQRKSGDLGQNFYENLPRMLNQASEQSKAMASRKSSHLAIQAFAPFIEAFTGGSADLTGSNLTSFEGCELIHEKGFGNYLSYGVREFAMAAIANGLSLYGGFIPYVGTFLTFSDYNRNAIRMAALMKIRVIHVFTHDSIGLGEDGPTHQSIEHLSSLRLIPNCELWRPSDQLETFVAWQCALENNDRPTLLALSRQSINPLPKGKLSNSKKDIPSLAKAIAKGGYCIKADENPQICLLATGSEMDIAIETYQKLQDEGIASLVVSMPCTERFDQQSAEYRNQILPKHLPIIAIEAGQTDFWHKYVQGFGSIIGIDCFGESAPANELYQYFGINAEAAFEASKQWIGVKHQRF